MRNILLKLLLLILSLSLALALFGCAPDSDDEGDDGNDDEDDGDDGDDAPLEGLVLVKDYVAQFNVVQASGAGSSGVRAASDLVKKMRNLGVEINDVVLDNSARDVTDCEIIIGCGARNRGDEFNINKTDLGHEGYVIKVIGNKVIIAGGTTGLTKTAVEKFISDYMMIDDETEWVEDLAIAGDIEEIRETEYDITEITLGGVEMSDYSLVCDYNDRTVYEVVQVLQESLYMYAGYWVEMKDITDTTEEESRFIMRIVSDAGENGFRVYFSEGDFIIETAFENAFQNAYDEFIEEYIINKHGKVNLPSSFTYEKLVSKVYYEDFGAVGDGVTDDFEAIMQAHQSANAGGQTVFAVKPNSSLQNPVFYIGGSSNGKTIPIKTDVDWTGAEFIIDDTLIPPYGGRTANVFRIAPSDDCVEVAVDSTKLEGLSLKPGDKKINMTFDTDSLIRVQYHKRLMFIRWGANEGDSPQQEALLVDKNGNIDKSTFVVWDYPEITEMWVMPINEKPITVKGGKFTTKVAQLCTSFPEGSMNGDDPWLTGDQYYYYNRGIDVRRSNVTIDGIDHVLVGEGSGGYPYNGFIRVSNVNHVRIKNCVLQGHKMYVEDRDINGDGTIQNNEKDAGTQMGTYDFVASASNDVLLINCSQHNDIDDDSYWGIMCSNFCRNIGYDGCNLSRFDAHQGAFNVSVKNTTLGHSFSVVGGGLLEVENVTKASTRNYLITLRGDYGSTWMGDVKIKNVTLTTSSTVYIFDAAYHRNWDFGYTVYMPQNITIENLQAPKSSRINLFSYGEDGITESSFTSTTNPLQLTKSITVTNQKQRIYLAKSGHYLYNKKSQITITGTIY